MPDMSDLQQNLEISKNWLAKNLFLSLKRHGVEISLRIGGRI